MSAIWVDKTVPERVRAFSLAVSTTATISLGGSPQAGDIAVLFDVAVNSSGFPTLVTPTGFTSLVAVTGGSTGRVAVSAKILTEADLSATITGMNGSSSNQKLLYRLAFDGPAEHFDAAFNAEFTSGNPSAQVISAAGKKGVVAALAVAAAGSTPSFSSTSPSFQAQTGVLSNDMLLYRSFFNIDETPTDFTVDMADLGGRNALISGYLSVR